MYQDRPPSDKFNAAQTRRTFLGERKVIEQTQVLLDRVLPESFGYYALALGDLARSLEFGASPIKHWFYLSPDAGDTRAAAKVQFDALPIASDSIDCVVMAHLIDAYAKPHDLLREVERVMIPDGKLVMTGVNPVSWFGAQTLAAKWLQKPTISQRLIGLSRIKDWLKLIGFEVEIYGGLNFRHQTQHPLWQSVASHFCSHYFIMARKSVSTLTPIRPSWRHNRKLVPARFAEPGVRRLVERELKKVQH
ncbi:MAG: methyltransferase domain-containing protein [Gammaproteobacteria bacterium]|nr:methyltransferase domain-containing protein [Gammaproteobacteria bacterium]